MPRPLLDRLIDFAVVTGEAADSMPRTSSGKAVSTQLARSGSSPAANYAEARNAVSAKEYVYKMHLCAKELRESLVWLTIGLRRKYRNADYAALSQECNELLAIATACAAKARRNDEQDEEEEEE